MEHYVERTLLNERKRGLETADQAAAAIGC